MSRNIMKDTFIEQVKQKGTIRTSLVCDLSIQRTQIITLSSLNTWGTTPTVWHGIINVANLIWSWLEKILDHKEMIQHSLLNTTFDVAELRTSFPCRRRKHQNWLEFEIVVKRSIITNKPRESIIARSIYGYSW